MTQDVRLRLSVVGQAQVVNALDSASASLDAVAGGGKRVVDGGELANGATNNGNDLAALGAAVA